MREVELSILNMISEGKITADEGARLLEALSGDQAHNARLGEKRSPGQNANTEAPDDIGAEIRGKIKHIYEDAEPHFKKTALFALESALESAAIIVSAVHKSVRDNLHDAEWEELK